MKISAIIPSRLERAPGGGLWVELASATVERQSLADEYEREVVVGVDRDVDPVAVRVRLSSARVAVGGTSQAEAANAAARAATGEVLAFLEDDDTWEPAKLRLQLPLLAPRGSFDLVTCNQTEVDGGGRRLRVNDFPTPSGWVLRADTWRELAGFDERFRYHLDNHFLGKVKAAGLRRVHLVERGAASRLGAGGWLDQVARYSDVRETLEDVPLVTRLANPHGGLASTASDPVADAHSRLEVLELVQTFGEVPW